MKCFIWFLLLLTSNLFAQDAKFKLNEVQVECKDSEYCASKKLRYSNLVGDYRSLVHLKETLRIMASDGGYESFYYEISESGDNHKLLIRVKLKPTIKEINIGFSDRNIEMDPTQLLNVKEGEFFESQRLDQDLEKLPKKLESMGFPHSSHQVQVKQKKDKVTVSLVITLGEPRIFKSIKNNSSSSFVSDYLVKKFFNQYNKPFEYTRFKLHLDEAQKELFNYGYYLINLDFAPIIKDNRVILDIKVSTDKLFAFDFRNLHQEHRQVIHELVKDLFRKYKRPLSESTLKMAIEEHYRKKALLNTQVDIQIDKFKNKYSENVTLYRIFLQEHDKTRLTSVNFTGNAFFTKDKLKEMYHDEAFELAKINFYDEEFLDYFVGFLKSKYIEKGFVQARVIGPTKTFTNGKQEASVEYLIHEGQRAIIRSLTFEGLPSELEDKTISKLSNKQGHPFNPISMAEDIKKVANYLQEKGYYFAEVSNANDDNLVVYSKSGTDVDIRFIVNPGPMVKLNRVIFLGNNKTRKKVLEKKITLEKGDIITPSKTREYESSLSSTGLFNSVTVTPIRHSSSNSATDLIVKVVEREFGLVEVAPGYRTDIGIKLTGTLSYINIGGMNRAVILRSQLNQRLNGKTLSPRREAEDKHILEHNTTLTYTQGDIFNTLIDFSATGAYQFKRFYNFDAEIMRGSTTFTRDFSKRFSTSARYQLEKITQSDADDAKDNGSFQIGAITPSFTWDLRNSPTLPLKGAFFNVSCEFANPFFLSQKEPDLTINYYKLVSRNRFYIPYKNGTFAISMVAGMEENLANQLQTINGQTQTEGYIPSIKVFRLTGVDIVRGFTDQEINRLPDGKDISEVRVDKRAYLANLKLEPRYFINDALMTGIFYDAGRVFVNEFDLSDLRDSVGITFKVVTPVGTLDFDYGIKLHRQKIGSGPDAKLESPGRFHVSIGFF